MKKIVVLAITLLIIALITGIVYLMALYPLLIVGTAVLLAGGILIAGIVSLILSILKDNCAWYRNL